LEVPNPCRGAPPRRRSKGLRERNDAAQEGHATRGRPRSRPAGTIRAWRWVETRRCPRCRRGPAMGPSPVVVLDRDGLRGTIERPDSLAAGPEARVEVLFEGGRRVETPAGSLILQQDGTYRLPLAVAERD